MRYLKFRNFENIKSEETTNDGDEDKDNPDSHDVVIGSAGWDGVDVL